MPVGLQQMYSNIGVYSKIEVIYEVKISVLSKSSIPKSRIIPLSGIPKSRGFTVYILGSSAYGKIIIYKVKSNDFDI